MALFDFFKKKPTYSIEPYSDSSINLFYNLLFCDDLELYKKTLKSPYLYPFDILFSDTSSKEQCEGIINDAGMEPRIKILAYNKLNAKGHGIAEKELLGVIVEVGLEGGLDVLAAFKDGTARYINHSGKIIVWETTDDENANQITNKLFQNSVNIVNNIGIWDNPRQPHPIKGNCRITFLVSDGIYFGEAPTELLFNDAMANPALTNATELMRYLIAYKAS
jgi:hypothetical protein